MCKGRAVLDRVQSEKCKVAGLGTSQALGPVAGLGTLALVQSVAGGIMPSE